MARSKQTQRKSVKVAKETGAKTETRKVKAAKTCELCHEKCKRQNQCCYKSLCQPCWYKYLAENGYSHDKYAFPCNFCTSNLSLSQKFVGLWRRPLKTDME